MLNSVFFIQATTPAADTAHAATTTTHGMEIGEFLLIMVAILVAAKVLGELAERIGQPAVLGELLAGVLLGVSVFGILDPNVEVMHLMAEIGVILLLFQIGLETDLARLLKVGPASLLVAAVGVLLPFVLGYGIAHLLGLDVLTAVVCGAALTATSVGITARVLADLGRLQDPESQIILGAAVIDDIIGLVILAVVSDVISGGVLTATGIATTTLVAFGFVAAVLLLGRVIVPPLLELLSRLGKEQTLGTMALALAFLTAFLADSVGSAHIVGAFAAGLVIAPTRHAHVVEHNVGRLSLLFVPIFFVTVGAQVDVRSFLDPQVLTVGAALIVVAVLGKFAAGYAPFWFRGKKSVIGVGMIPRGEVGLIFAQVGVKSGALTTGLFSALTLMVMVTTFMAPPLLKLLFPPRVPQQSISGVAEITTEA